MILARRAGILFCVPRRDTLSAQLRPLIDRCGRSRYRICKQIGLSESAMSRFMSGERGLSLDVFDRLFQLLGLHVIVGPKAKGMAKSRAKDTKGGDR